MNVADQPSEDQLFLQGYDGVVGPAGKRVIGEPQQDPCCKKQEYQYHGSTSEAPGMIESGHPLWDFPRPKMEKWMVEYHLLS